MAEIPVSPSPSESPEVPATLDSATLRRWLFRAREDLGRHRGRIDALNVFPVPDGDTGTNMYLTLDAGLRGFVDALLAQAREGDAPLGIADGTAALARATLYAARGNSGVILSQLVAGVAAVVAEAPQVESGGVDGPLLARMLTEADVRARRAVAASVEGTILTVVRAAAQAASAQVEAGRGALGDVLAAADDAARTALADTPRRLEALARAGVVDAGGAGFVVVLDALGAVLRGEGQVEGEPSATDWGEGIGSPHAPEVRSPEFEVMFLLDGLDEAGAARLRARLEQIGDSVLVAGDSGLRTVHVHTDEPGLAVEAGMLVGRPYGVRLSRLCEPGAECVDPPEAVRTTGLGVVACVQAPRLVTLFEEHGAVVLADAPGRRVTPAQFVEAARATGAARVAVLPDDGDAVLAASAAGEIAAEEGIDLVVVPAAYLLQGLAALAVADLADPDSVAEMTTAAESVRCGFVATATVAATTDAGPCRPGDVLGVADDRVAHVGGDVREVALALVRELATGGEQARAAEIVTLVEGAACPGLGESLVEDVVAMLGEVEVTVLDGGQAVYDLLIGVE